jgi:hypothetical protein
MRVTRMGHYAARAILGLGIGTVLGCGESTKVELVDVEQRLIPPGKKIEELSKKERQRVGGSAFQTRDPSGMNREAPAP